jgi:hypothetical protein
MKKAARKDGLKVIGDWLSAYWGWLLSPAPVWLILLLAVGIAMKGHGAQ